MPKQKANEDGTPNLEELTCRDFALGMALYEIKKIIDAIDFEDFEKIEKWFSKRRKQQCPTSAR